MTAKKMSDPCPAGGSFPDNFDGEFTRCGNCGRRLNLDRGGLVPRHNRKATRGFANASELRE